MKANRDIRDAVEEHGFRLWELAEALGLQDSNLSKKLRRELPEDEKKKIFSTIGQMAHSREGAMK